MLGVVGFGLELWNGNDASPDQNLHRNLEIAIVTLGGSQILLGMYTSLLGHRYLASSRMMWCLNSTGSQMYLYVECWEILLLTVLSFPLYQGPI